MSFPDEKSNSDFDWEEGGVLDDQNTVPVKEVREKGIPKISTAVHADPVKRKADRDKKILNVQSRAYCSKNTKKNDDSIIIEESQSGLSRNIEDSAAKRLIDKGDKFRGFDRFGDQKKKED